MDLTFRIRIRCLLIIGEVNGVLQEWFRFFHDALIKSQKAYSVYIE